LLSYSSGLRGNIGLEGANPGIDLAFYFLLFTNLLLPLPLLELFLVLKLEVICVKGFLLDLLPALLQTLLNEFLGAYVLLLLLLIFLDFPLDSDFLL